MLKIHKPFSKHKLFLISITSICITFGLLGFYYLTYTPELSHAEQIDTDYNREKRTLANIKYMQDITPEICANTEEADIHGNYQYQLKDSRDQKTYWVAKLKDGNCWMTQNLAYDGGGSSVRLDSWGSGAQYYDSGSYVNVRPQLSLRCDKNDIGLSYCIGRGGWAAVSDKEASTESDFYVKNKLVVKENTYDAHFRAGNYYSWFAAINNINPGSQDGDQALESICPNKWNLPLSKESNNTVNGSFYNLLSKYGLQGSITNNEYDIRTAPLYFLYGGYLGGAVMMNAGSSGYYWSSVTRNYINSYAMIFNELVATSNGNNDRGALGFSIRCFSPGGEKKNYDNVEIAINPMVSLDVAEAVVVERSETNPSTADLKVKVSSNQPYSVNINAREHAELISENGDKIPSNGSVLTTAENNWGIMKPGDTIYTKVTTTPQLFYQATSAEAKDILFKIGISTAPDLANGEYSTDITVTATQN